VFTCPSSIRGKGKKKKRKSRGSEHVLRAEFISVRLARVEKGDLWIKDGEQGLQRDPLTLGFPDIRGADRYFIEYI